MLEIKENKIVGMKNEDIEFISEALEALDIKYTPEMVEELSEKGETLLEKPKSLDAFSSLGIYEMIKVDEPSISKTKKAETRIPTDEELEDDFFDFEEEENNETIGEYMSYVFVDGWNISKAQVRRGIAVEETALEFLSNGKCKMNKRTVSGPTINYLRGIASEIKLTITGMDGKVYSTVITKEEKGVKIVRFTVAEETGDVMITYFLKQRDMLAKERELAMWR